MAPTTPAISIDATARELRRRCVAIIGAAEALAREMLLEKIDEGVTASTLRSLIVSWLE